ncbi:unnamed protein product [Strongylus vulgaris]|uniref:CMP/dCMP-type deaminase domain-containing protein n=1 Tax=Strongylus vulgaris TaxID=40348 RepID=A0A3P7JFY7_STRVU|nr:unnamed protein product [Strongylus vulgaris]
MPVNDEDLVQKARDIMKNAYCPYSKFPVGAAILAEDGSVIVGVNCENASYGGTICAERNAMTTALAQGHRKFKAIAVCKYKLGFFSKIFMLLNSECAGDNLKIK